MERVPISTATHARLRPPVLVRTQLPSVIYRPAAPVSWCTTSSARNLQEVLAGRGRPEPEPTTMWFSISKVLIEAA